MQLPRFHSLKTGMDWSTSGEEPMCHTVWSELGSALARTARVWQGREKGQPAWEGADPACLSDGACPCPPQSLKTRLCEGLSPTQDIWDERHRNPVTSWGSDVYTTSARHAELQPKLLDSCVPPSILLFTLSACWTPSCHGEAVAPGTSTTAGNWSSSGCTRRVCGIYRHSRFLTSGWAGPTLNL